MEKHLRFAELLFPLAATDDSNLLIHPEPLTLTIQPPTDLLLRTDTQAAPNFGALFVQGRAGALMFFEMCAFMSLQFAVFLKNTHDFRGSIRN